MIGCCYLTQEALAVNAADGSDKFRKAVGEIKDVL